jgi:NADH:ubiquinone oxidoreductase subunit 6 (subunit J)
VSFDGWLIALHVLSAFAYVGGIVLFWVLVVAVRKVDTPEGTIRMEPIVKVGNITVGVGAGGTLLLGIWLAFKLDSYAIWDGWIVAALVLWVLAMAIGQRTGVAYTRGMAKAKELEAAGQAGPNGELLALNRTTNGVVLHALASVVLLLILLDMIFKPGA